MLPVETLRRILLHLTRDDLDAVHLVSHSFASLIEADVFVKHGPLRTLEQASVLSDTTVRIKNGDRVMIIRPLDMIGAAWIRHSFVELASIDANVARWYIVNAASVFIADLRLNKPFPTQQLQDEFFNVVKCRKVHLDYVVAPGDIRSALTSKLLAPCDDITLGSLRDPVGVSVAEPEDLVTFVLEGKRSFIDDAPSDVLVAQTPFSGYDRCVFVNGCIRIGAGGAKQLVATLREKVGEATKACPTFFMKVFDTQMARDELPKLRHLNKVTGQHFVVDRVRHDAITVKCITVLQKKEE